MASSPKRKQSLKKSKRNFHLGLVFVYTLSILVAMFFLLEQKENIPLYSKYIKTFGKVAKTDGDVISNIRSDVKKIEHINEIKVISILGERNTGTTWMYEHLNKCFNHTIPIKRRLTRYKHWFQDEKIGSPIINQTLVLSMFRNSFEWTEAMRSKPHHAPMHMFIKNWKEFVTKKWSMDRVGKDLKMTEDEKNLQLCQENFLYRDIISCHTRPYPPNAFNKTHYSEHQPFYEMRYDGSGLPFDNILELRAAKIRNFMSVINFNGVKDVWIIQYENLVSKGTNDLIKSIEAASGVSARCSPSPPQSDRKKRKLKKEFMDYLMQNLDWEAENLVGYSESGMKNPSTIFFY
mmetsp:Transcript_26192/g.29935  ORF Transcript_26192/g.29935 Transcript_26192/m.29935 type:complete len:348 (-) Transcript_26192:220-1263(-)